jgi:hypothetical protein
VTSGIVIDNLTFQGGGVSFSGEHVPAHGIRVSNSAFLNILNSGPDWPVHNGLFFPSGLRDGVIEGNRFFNILDGGSTDPTKFLTANAILAYHGLDRTSITNNSFEKVQQGIYVQFSGGGPYVDVVIARNSGTKVHRMGIEMQGGGTTNLLVEDNYFTDFLDPNPGTFGISAAVDGGKHSVVRNNTVIAQPAATTDTLWGKSYGIGIEIGGEDASVYGNYIGGLWHLGVAIGNAPNAAIRDNYLCGSPGARDIRPESSLRLTLGIHGNVHQADCKSEKRGRGTNTGPRSALRNNKPPKLLEVSGDQVSLYNSTLCVGQGAIVHDDLGDITREVSVEVAAPHIATIRRSGYGSQLASGTKDLLSVYVKRIGGSGLDSRGEREVGSDRDGATVMREIVGLRGAEAVSDI